MRTAVAGAMAASVVFWAAGCGKRPAPVDPGPAPAGAVQMTVEVKGMTKALNIT
jgi:hypothetical protein